MSPMWNCHWTVSGIEVPLPRARQNDQTSGRAGGWDRRFYAPRVAVPEWTGWCDVWAASSGLRAVIALADANGVRRLYDDGSDLGVLGAEDTLAALQLGQVDELVIIARPDILTNVDHLATTGPDIAPTPNGRVTPRDSQSCLRVFSMKSRGPFSSLPGSGYRIRQVQVFPSQVGHRCTAAQSAVSP